MEGLGIDAQDNLYLTEWLGHTVLKIAANGSVTTIAGTRRRGIQRRRRSGDSSSTVWAQRRRDCRRMARSTSPTRATTVSRKVAPDGTISTIAGTGSGIGNILLPPSFSDLRIFR